MGKNAFIMYFYKHVTANCICIICFCTSPHAIFTIGGNFYNIDLHSMLNKGKHSINYR